MKNLAFVMAVALLLSGCGAAGGGEKAAMVATCIDARQSEKSCNCVAEKLQADLDGETFKLVAQALAESQDTGDDLLSALPPGKQEEVMVTLMSASAACSSDPASGG